MTPNQPATTGEAEAMTDEQIEKLCAEAGDGNV